MATGSDEPVVEKAQFTYNDKTQKKKVDDKMASDSIDGLVDTFTVVTMK